MIQDDAVPEAYGEICQRCGEIEEDRRTLYTACFYELDELGLPFTHKVLFHAKIEDLAPDEEPHDFTLKNGDKLRLSPGTVRCKSTLIPQKLYTLRICKHCRADWMQSMVQWFQAPVTRSEPDEWRCVPVRENGVTVYITEAEWHNRRANVGKRFDNGTP